MNTRSSATNLVGAVKQLTTEWEAAKTHWRDVKAQEFERAYLEQLPGQIARAMAAIDEIDLLLRKVRADCE